MRRLLFIMLLISCGRHEAELFSMQIHKIDSAVVDVTAASDLHYIKDFKRIYNHPTAYLDSAKSYLAGAHSDNEKFIVICSMNKLKVSDYYEFLENCYHLFAQNLISENLLQSAISSDCDEGNYIVIKNYKLPKLNRLLVEIRNDSRISTPFKEWLSDIISGNAYSRIAD